MLKIRLRRVGKTKQPMYRIVVADSRAPRDGAFVEALGYYHPLENPSKIVLDADRARHWLGKGAQPSDRVAKILKIEQIAEIPPKLQTRIALGEQRAKEAASKAKEAPAAEAAAPAAAAEEPLTAEPATEAPAEAQPAAEVDVEDEGAPEDVTPAETQPSADLESAGDGEESAPE